uniref:SUEL-type lectin domain-containing protein n=1 Tax=Hippocampus comes TaxID=109280 RepID=A0A3Q2XK82_HIPCM
PVLKKKKNSSQFLMFAVADYVDQVTTCDNNGKSNKRLANTTCSQQGTVDKVKTRYASGQSCEKPACFVQKCRFFFKWSTDVCRSWLMCLFFPRSCNGKKSCELGLSGFRTPDPCVGTFKYLQTNFTCLEASMSPTFTVVTCEGSVAHLYCGMGRVIAIYGADYGRRDRTTCSYRRAPHGLKNITCLQPTDLVAQICSVAASNAVFTDPCIGTYKYLEVSYACKCK